jgi:hypothetical protein
MCPGTQSLESLESLESFDTLPCEQEELAEKLSLASNMAEPHSFLSIDTALDSNGTTVANGPSLTDGISISPALSTTQSTGTVKAAKDGHTTGSKTTRLKADDNPTEDDPMILQIYNKLNEMFGQGVRFAREF